MKKILACLILSLILAAPAMCETSVWVAKTDSSVLYIGGTIHLLRESDYPFPPEFDSAYSASEKLVFETDLTALNTPEFQQMLLAEAVYPDGRTLDSVLSDEAYEKLGTLCAEYGLPLEALNKFRPSMVVLTLVGLEVQKLGLGNEGVDMFYHKKATTDAKPIEGLESVKEQLDVLLSMGEGNEDAYILYNADMMKKMGEAFDSIATAWRSGDEQRLVDLFVTEMKKDFPKLFHSVFTNRNMNWLPKIEQYLLSPETELVLVGTGHLVGEEGVIEQLERLGYEVEKLK